MSSVEIFMVVASMLGGLALFLFGMNTLSGSLSSMTGGLLDRVLGKITKSAFMGFLFGAGLTAIVQSSSAITVLSVGLVNSGIIGLKQAASLIIGANLGTTATAWVISLNAMEGQSLLMTIVKPSSFSPFLAIVGVGLTMFSKSQTKKNIGNVLLGFSVMMIGMNLMSQAVSPLRELPALTNTLMSFTNPVLGFLFAMLFTMLVQSSDAVIGIVQAERRRDLRHGDSAGVRCAGGHLRHRAAFLDGGLQKRQAHGAGEPVLQPAEDDTVSGGVLHRQRVSAFLVHGGFGGGHRHTGVPHRDQPSG